jgi:hypothetical protein
MASINKNFAIKNGIEVGENLIFGDKDKFRVGIGTVAPNYTLEVRGGIGATFVSVGQSITASTGSISSFRSTNVTVGGELNFQSGVGTGLNISGISTVGSLNIGSTEVIDSSRQLKNISSLDATTTATIEAAIANGPNTFTDLIVSGIATFNSNVGVAGIVTAPAISASWSQVGSGLTFTTGIGTNLNISGIVTALSFRPSSGYYQSPNGSNAFYVYDGTGNVAFQGTIGASQLNSASGNKVVELAISDASFVNNVSIAGTLSASNAKIIGIASVGSGITLTSSGDARYAGIITANKFFGDGSGLTGTISGVGINSGGVTVGTGITFINFTGSDVSAITASSGIATIDISGGGGGNSTIDKETFNVGAAGTNLLTLTNPYKSGNIDVYLNGLKLSPGDFSETSSNTIGLTTSAVNGDTIDIVSFRTVGSIGDIGLRVQQDGVGIGTSISTLNFVGGATTFFNRGNNILDVYFTGIPVGDLYELDSISPAGGENTYTPTFNYDTVSVTDPFRLLISVNGVMQSAYVHNTEYVHNNYLLASRTGYTIDYDGKIKFTESLPEGSDVIIKTTAGTTKSTTRKYPFNALDILF